LNPGPEGNLLIEVYDGSDALARACGVRFITVVRNAVDARGIATVALAGGATPKDLYNLLATDAEFRASTPWPKIHFFFGDERDVPPVDAQSNFAMVNGALLGHLPAHTTNVHRVHTEHQDASAAAREYEDELAVLFHRHHAIVSGFPRFDLVLLGLGPDGHVASLFPDSFALDEKKRWVVATWVAKLNTNRVTMTLPVFNQAAEIIMLVAGQEKAEIVGRVLGRVPAQGRLPAQLIQPVNGICRWMLDKAAAGQLA
jgi:6-phosphogluconolactonase